MNTTTRRRVSLVAACLVTAVTLTACGDDDETVSETTAAAAATTVAADTEETTTTEAPEETTATTAEVEETTPTTEASDDATETTEASDESAAGETVVVTAVDYRFEGLPETVPVGTKISLVNEGNEPHEFVAILIPAEETRSVEELVQLPEEELGEVFGSSEPATVILAAHGQTDMPGPVVGDGTLNEPGRYAIVCFLPVGSDDSMLESEDSPQAEGPPHAMQGMVAELTVVP